MIRHIYTSRLHRVKRRPRGIRRTELRFYRRLFGNRLRRRCGNRIHGTGSDRVLQASGDVQRLARPVRVMEGRARAEVGRVVVQVEEGMVTGRVEEGMVMVRGRAMGQVVMA